MLGRGTISRSFIKNACCHLIPSLDVLMLRRAWTDLERFFKVDRQQLEFREAYKLFTANVLKNSIFQQTFVGIKNVSILPVFN